ncbi:MAG: zinc-dependent metalloprotease [Planctomycetes bacterium]|nr:zinc-dependent metalloprotease [Planctomycetota bacterium]
MFRCISTGLMAISLAWAGTDGGAPVNAEAPDVVKMSAPAEAKPPASPKEKPPFPPFDEITKDMVAQEGMFTLWSYPSSAKDKDPEKLLCQIPAGFIGEKFMISTSVSGGGFFTNFPLDEYVVQWELLDKQLVLVQPETHYVVDEKDPVSDVVRRTYPERIRAAVKIVTKTPEGDPVIDLGKMLKSNFADIAWMSMGPFSSGRRGAGINASLSKWTKKKAFELNVEIGVALAVGSTSPPGSFDKKMVHFSFWKLPKSDYASRTADDRIGYFLTTNQDWAKPTESRDIFNRYVDRWHLVKRDPKLSLCDPKQPIIFYIEKTVPVRFRRAVRDGILEWNKAFEKIGFVNAVVVRQQTNDNEWKDLDPEDMRYSFFRWIVTGGGFAMGPHRANPYTGQIYDADIVFDDSMVRFYEQSAQRMLPTSAMEMRMGDPAVRAFLEAHPQWKRPTRDWERFAFGESKEPALRDLQRERMRRRGHIACDYAQGMKHQLALGYAMLAEKPKEVIDRFLYDVIKEVVMHEVGHTLGLRHNFKASTIYSLEEIKRRRETGEPTTGSVMDYNPVLFFEKDALKGHFLTPTLGPYDYWAIEYGYRPADGSYKAPGDSKDEPKAPDNEEKTADRASDKTSSETVSDIPKDVFDKLPEEARKLITAHAAKAGDSEAESPKKSSTPAFSGPNAAELKMLDQIASRAAEPELAYASDEDTTIFGPDPRSNRFDLSGDPVERAREQIALVNERLDSILDWAVKDKESWYHLRPTFGRLMFEKTRVIAVIGNYIGGQYTSRSHRGDPDAVTPLRLVDVKLQRDAMAFLEEQLFTDKFFSVSPEVLNHLTAARWWHHGTRMDMVVDYPIHDVIAGLQWWTLFPRLFPNTLRRIHDAEMKTTAADRLTVAEYLQRLQRACWRDSVDGTRLTKGPWSDTSPFVSSIRRSLQREYLTLMEPLVRTRPGTVISPDLHAMVQHVLRTLQEEIEKVREGEGLDFASQAHLVSCQSRIERMLTPELKEYGM